MLAEEYVPFAYHLQFGAGPIKPSKYIFNLFNFTQQRFYLTNHRISAQQKVLTRKL